MSCTRAQAQKFGLSLGAGMSERLKRGGAAEADEEQALRALLSHSDGARGFYVTTLTAPELQNVTLPRSHPEHYRTREKE